MRMRTEKAHYETPVQFTNSYDIPRGPIDGHGDLMAPIPPGQWCLSDGSSLIMEKFRKKIRSKLRIDMFFFVASN